MSGVRERPPACGASLSPENSMSLLADENFPRPAVIALRKSGFAVVWISEDNPGSSDEDVLARCAQEGCTLLTLDKDFGELRGSRGTVSLRLPAPLLPSPAADGPSPRS